MTIVSNSSLSIVISSGGAFQTWGQQLCKWQQLHGGVTVTGHAPRTQCQNVCRNTSVIGTLRPITATKRLRYAELKVSGHFRMNFVHPKCPGSDSEMSGSRTSMATGAGRAFIILSVRLSKVFVDSIHHPVVRCPPCK